MAKITTPDKSTGDPHTAAEYNAFKDAINAAYDLIPAKVTDSSTIALLANSANWNTTNQYSGSAISGQKQGDWYDDGSFRYMFITSTVVSRIPYAYL